MNEMTHLAVPALRQLAEMLALYRNGQRELPTYSELAELVK